MTTAPEPEPVPQKSRFALPSAYTILFALIVLAAIATWIVPAGTYNLDEEGAPIPGTYHEVDAKPSRILVDSITAPINGLYGIEDAKGNINYYNEGTLFGAIDVALFIIVIGGFLGVTMKTGAIQAGIGSLVRKLEGRERLMIPALMTVFALGGTSYGMAEESLAFYALVITVLIAAGYDALTGAAVVLLGCWALYQAVYAESILEKMLWAYTIYSAALTPVVLAAFYSKRVTAWGAVAAIASGTVVTLSWDLPAVRALFPPILAQRDAIFPALFASLFALVVVSLFTPPPSPAQLQPFAD